MIHERGYWLSQEEIQTHEFDEQLCNAIIKRYNSVRQAVDIGCGNGKYTMALIGAGIICTGYDGSPLTPEITRRVCKTLDFSDPVDIGKFDLVLSLEVGEHIPRKYEQVFLDNLVRAANEIIIMSWAVEGQPGIGHFNCRDNDYIIAEMFARGFDLDYESTDHLREQSSLPWFKNTLMVFTR
ncbi:MAG TPA: methyltransferase domain-containing protein [Candidatus Cloacimonadota bacterium]|nr:methyltransferase domain-containing protein [Candidatus Cloacimonadota bacterium]HPS38835.1 methyltransferase domain-containing protein [Candidatus Cloacimonadota bacterium]